MREMYDEEAIARALRDLPRPPEGWILAAQQLPAARAALDGLVERALADASLRETVLADLVDRPAAGGRGARSPGGGRAAGAAGSRARLGL